ncbi:LysM peptidoglycan-binding domain-containing protein [Chryseobacterium sp. L7]|uniref:LysM peptidoglycan-binding domain-containing protein n=1 Tax=Chryseobacterium endalhagicum TaxID=2797638 RepID=A0ABS1QMJ3_9FLAO|nr:LysM domain-containing protein [Chryseobacterium endalhagicum]MBL1223108.1 LysM peptidoglycan-binding domain-containing protein [Chryseobacterium endalhagicum]
MKVIKYEIKKGDTLASIAEKYEIGIEYLKTFHNSHSGLASLIIGDKLPIQLNHVIINAESFKDVLHKNQNVKDLNFNLKSRYRCEQLNITRVNNEVITMSASTYLEFLVQKVDYSAIFNISMTDFTFSVDPAVFNKGFEFSHKFEKIKSPITVEISKYGTVDRVYNRDDIEQRWIKFRDFELVNDDMFKQLSSQAPTQAKDVVDTGNKEFLKEDNFARMVDKNLFYHIFFRAFQGGNLENYTIDQFSQIFPNINLSTDVVKSVVNEDENSATYRLVGTLNRSNLSEEILTDMYDKIYKPTLKYSYSEFDFVYRITYTINKKNNFITEGKASIAEKVKNNFEIITEYKIKQVEL